MLNPDRKLVFGTERERVGEYICVYGWIYLYRRQSVRKWSWRWLMGEASFWELAYKIPQTDNNAEFANRFINEVEE